VLKSELILHLADQNPHLFQRDAEKVVNAILDEIVAALTRGDRVELRGFGTFAVKVREGRVGRNPKTGTLVHVPERKFTLFKPGRGIQRRLNPEVMNPQEE
jgi:integration host factor subunit beta